MQMEQAFRGEVIDPSTLADFRIMLFAAENDFVKTKILDVIQNSVTYKDGYATLDDIADSADSHLSDQDVDADAVPEIRQLLEKVVLVRQSVREGDTFQCEVKLQTVVQKFGQLAESEVQENPSRFGELAPTALMLAEAAQVWPGHQEIRVSRAFFTTKAEALENTESTKELIGKLGILEDDANKLGGTTGDEPYAPFT